MATGDFKNDSPYDVIPGEKLNEYGLMQLEDDQQYFPVAVVGLGCRFPGAFDLREFRDVLMKQMTTYEPLPEDGRWNRKEWSQNPLPHMPGHIQCPSAGFLPTKRQFDYSFFNISPKEAMAMEPQQHEAMEVTQEALEDGGFTKDNPLPSNTAVFLSMRMGETVPPMTENPYLLTPYMLTGGAHTTLANRVSFFWNLRGGSMGVDGADTASTHSVHFGIWALWNRECDAVIAGGMNGILQTFYQLAFDDLGHLSTSGSCRPFDVDADGKVRCEGAAVVVLRPLADALKAGNHIHCVIRASQVNFSNKAFTLGQQSQDTFADCIGGTYEKFGIPPEKIDFIEAHATGKAEEDVMEMQALGKVFEKNKDLRVGSLKGNIGHADCASGMSQLIKAALMIQKRELYPQANFAKIHPDLQNVPTVQVQTSNEKFTKSKNMMVGIDSFAYTGQVCHMVLEEFKNKVQDVAKYDLAGWKFGESNKTGRTVPVVLSAKSKDALKDYVRKWMEFEWDEDDAQVVTSWLATNRDHFSNRVVILANSTQDFREKANMFLERTPCDEVIDGVIQKERNAPKVCIVFPGQGQQWWDMGRQLYEHEPVYREIVDECDKLWKKYSGYSFLEKDRTFVKDKGDANPANIDNIITAQPAIVANQIGLFKLLQHWGVKADGIVGHSLGEVAAAFAAGGLSLEECMSSIYVRAWTQTKLAGTGSMAAARFSPKEADEFVSKYEDLYVACYNSTDNVTVAGGTSVVEKLAAENPKKLKIIRVQAAFHTPHLNAVYDEFYDMIKGKIEDRQTDSGAKLYSTVKKGIYNGPFNADYWWTNVSEPVYFTQATEEIFKDFGSDVIFLEIGSSATMLSSIRQSAKKLGVTPSGYVHFGLRNKDDHQSALKGFAQLHAMGFPVHWGQVTRDCAQYIPLPTYPFQRTFYELTAKKLTDRLTDNFDKSFFARHGKINASDHPFLFKMMYNKEHVFPPSAIIEYLAEMCKEDNICLRDVVIQGKPPALNNFTPANDISYNMMENSCDGNKLMIQNPEGGTMATALKLESPLKAGTDTIDVEAMKKRFGRRMEASEIYNLLMSMGIECENDLKQVHRCFIGDGEVLGELDVPTNKFECLHTLTLEAALNVVTAAFSTGKTIKSLDKVRYLFAPVPRIETNEQIFAYARLTDWCTERFEVDLYLTTLAGDVLLTAEGCQFTSWATRCKGEFLHSVSENISLISDGEKMPIDNWVFDLDQQEFLAEEKVRLDTDEVSVRVKAVGNADGFLQCSGIIEETGAGVTTWKAGDRVIALCATSAIKSLITCSQSKIVAKPEKLSWADASTFGITYGLAHMTLADTCELQGSQRVLIYGSDRPLGKIVTSVARSLNAKVISCGNGTLPCNVKQVSPTVGEEVAQIIHDEELDIIINLEDDGVPESLFHLAGDSCVLCSVSNGEQSKMSYAIDSLMVHCHINVKDCIQRNSAELKASMTKVIKLLEEEKLALSNVSTTELLQLPGNKDADISAITVPDSKPCLTTSKELQFEMGDAFVITHGFSGLGMMLAEWLTKKGISDLVIISRQKPNQLVHRLFLNNMRNAGTKVHVIKGDLSKANGPCDAVRALNLNIKGIFHLAAMTGQTAVTEAETLQNHFLNLQVPLRYFLIISAGSGLSKSPEEDMAKSLDEVASNLQSKELISTNIRLGMLLSTSIIDENPSMQRRLEAQGTRPIDSKAWLGCLEQLMQMDNAPSSAAILNQDWTAAFLDETTDKTVFKPLVNMEDVRYRLQVKERRLEELTETFHTFLADLLCWPRDVVQLDVPLNDLGVDLYITDLINRWMLPRYKITLDWQDVHRGLTGYQTVGKMLQAANQ